MGSQRVRHDWATSTHNVRPSRLDRPSWRSLERHPLVLPEALTPRRPKPAPPTEGAQLGQQHVFNLSFLNQLCPLQFTFTLGMSASLMDLIWMDHPQQIGLHGTFTVSLGSCYPVWQHRPRPSSKFKRIKEWGTEWSSNGIRHWEVVRGEGA